MFTTSAYLFKDTPARSSFTLKPEKKCNYNLYSVSKHYIKTTASRSWQPNEPAPWGPCLDRCWRLWFLRWSFLIWPFLYGSLSSRCLYASSYCHANKTHFHEKVLHFLIASRCFGTRKLAKWHLICSAERGWLRSLQASRLPIGGIQEPLRLLIGRNISLTCEKRR